MAFENFAIDRYFIARSDAEAVTRLNMSKVDFFVAAIFCNAPGCRWSKLQKRSDGA
jgi:hypothetical protein